MSVFHINSLGKRFLDVEHDTANGWVHVRWRGRLTTEDVLLGCEYALTALRRTGCPQLLNDNRAVTGAWPHTNTWIAEQMAPQAEALGLRRLAHVLSPSVLARAVAEDLQRRVSARVEMEIFDELGPAQDWLRAGLLAPAPAYQQATG
jgi:hypothetical protein